MTLEADFVIDVEGSCALAALSKLERDDFRRHYEWVALLVELPNNNPERDVIISIMIQIDDDGKKARMLELALDGFWFSST